MRAPPNCLWNNVASPPARSTIAGRSSPWLLGRSLSQASPLEPGDLEEESSEGSTLDRSRQSPPLVEVEVYARFRDITFSRVPSSVESRGRGLGSLGESRWGDGFLRWYWALLSCWAE
jgi:hypothetical protein